MGQYRFEREAFAQLKRVMEEDAQLRQEVETVIAQLLERFDTSIRENRFIVGGVVEVIICAALRASGIPAEDVGISDQRIDIRIPNGGFSVKGHFRTGDIRLINVLGDSESASWDTATIFVLHGVGIGYADPELIGSEGIRREKDAVVLKYSALRCFLQYNQEYLIKCQVPMARKNATGSELASRQVASQILLSTARLRSALSH